MSVTSIEHRTSVLDLKEKGPSRWPRHCVQILSSGRFPCCPCPFMRHHRALPISTPQLVIASCSPCLRANEPSGHELSKRAESRCDAQSESDCKQVGAALLCQSANGSCTDCPGALLLGHGPKHEFPKTRKIRFKKRNKLSMHPRST